MLIALNKIQNQIKPKHEFDKGVHIIKALSFWSCKSHIKHGSDTRIPDQKQYYNIKDSLSFVSLVNNNSILTRNLRTFVILIVTGFVHTVNPGSPGGDGS